MILIPPATALPAPIGDRPCDFAGVLTGGADRHGFRHFSGERQVVGRLLAGDGGNHFGTRQGKVPGIPGEVDEGQQSGLPLELAGLFRLDHAARLLAELGGKRRVETDGGMHDEPAAGDQPAAVFRLCEQPPDEFLPHHNIRLRNSRELIQRRFLGTADTAAPALAQGSEKTRGHRLLCLGTLPDGLTALEKGEGGQPA